jgi:hypothetical protein
MAKMRTKALRQLHADLGKILEDYDASCAVQAKAADEDDDAPDAVDVASAQQKQAAGHRAHDSAHGGTASMREAFGPNWNRVNNR